MNDMRGTSGLRLATEPQTVVKFNIHVTSELEETQHHIATPISPIVGCACMHILRLIILGRNTLR